MRSIFDGFEQNGVEVFCFDKLKDDEGFLSVLVDKEQFDYIVGYDFAGLKIKIDNNLSFCIVLAPNSDSTQRIHFLLIQKRRFSVVRFPYLKTSQLLKTLEKQNGNEKRPIVVYINRHADKTTLKSGIIGR